MLHWHQGLISKYGKTKFVGCSKYISEERDWHLYFAIPPNVSEDELMAVMASGGELPSSENFNTSCVLAINPRISLRNCRKYLI
jgi:hypothetical protein